MNVKKHPVVIGLALMAAIAFGATALAQTPMTVTGILTDDFAIASDDGEWYDVAESEVAIEMFEMAGSRIFKNRRFPSQAPQSQKGLSIEIQLGNCLTPARCLIAGRIRVWNKCALEYNSNAFFLRD